ncbi:hypothetical protein ABES25_00185 [Bacillus gobiensis]|uniref:hypothetical protein n=1 Tax=Bacillus gobiensis TaxID=1441095 RepID=UPI003D1AAA73
MKKTIVSFVGGIVLATILGLLFVETIDNVIKVADRAVIESMDKVADRAVIESMDKVADRAVIESMDKVA